MKVIYTCGVWDLLHPGHLNILKQAKALGDYLIVGVCSDRLTQLYKNKLPILDEYARCSLLNELKCVDGVYIYDDPDQSLQLEKHNVDIFVIGEEFGKQGVQQHQNALDYCKLNNIPVKVIARTPDISTTKLSLENNHDAVKAFWNDRGQLLLNNYLDPWQAVSLTKSPDDAKIRQQKEYIEIVKAINYVTRKEHLLDLGCGVGKHTTSLAKYFDYVYAYDFVETFIEKAKVLTNDMNIRNIKYYVDDVCNFNKSVNYDCCLITGLLCCLDDNKYKTLLEKISYIPNIIIKDSFGTYKRLDLSNHYSKELQTYYTAYYRTPQTLIDDMYSLGYKKVLDNTVEFHRIETHIRLFLFTK